MFVTVHMTTSQAPATPDLLPLYSERWAQEPLDISVAVMCYNEEENLKPMVERTVKMLRGLGKSFEVVIINDGSQDHSGSVADASAWVFPEVRVIHHPKNFGIGWVLLDGYRFTRGNIVAILPADLQFAPEDLPRALEALAEADVVNITRNQRHDPFFRKCVSAFDQFLVWVFFGFRMRDLHWVKVYRRQLLNRVSLISRTPLVDTELLVRARRESARIVELDLPHHPRVRGTSTGGKFSLLVKTFIELLRLRMKL